MENKILRYWFDGFNRRDWKSMQVIYTDESLIHTKEGPLKGGKGSIELAKKWLAAIPDAKVTPLHTTREENDMIVIHWRVKGVLMGSIRDVAPTGKTVIFHGHSCFRFREDQKVVEQWNSIDYHPLKGKS